MSKQYVMGLDIGTTSAKAVIFTKHGDVVSEAEVGYATLHPAPGWCEQDPLEIEAAAIEAIHTAMTRSAIDKEAIISVGLSSAMHSLICVDAANTPLSPSITWADGRSAALADELRATDIGERIYLATGTPLHPMSPLLKLLWMQENKYEPYLKAAKFLSIKEFLTSRWFGEDAVDYSIASATGLFNIYTRQWHEEALSLASIRENQLSRPVPATHLFTGLDVDIAEQMRLDPNTPFVAGGSDGPLANLGIGAINPGETAITIGTSGAIRQMSAAPHTDSRQEVFCYAFTDDLWVLGGPTNNGGNVLEWLKNTIGHAELTAALETQQDPFDVLIDAANQVAPGADQLLFLPYLNGERAPHWDASARGAFIGLCSTHTSHHMARAGLEGVLYAILSVAESLEALTGETEKLYANGGFARSEIWVQMLADMFGREVHLPVSHQSSAWGAAWVSLYAVGEVTDLRAIKQSIPMKGVVVPDMEKHEVYRKMFEVFREMYGVVGGSVRKLQRV
ncbi:gluconokinase [Paenalkalicoccus suaedae]|uniref:Gluconokinase n=1 Tax=Paenalkalicoccus suaedae TaxID=2592382 RepID=A0A859FJB8_9BACI|nr:gluconokinase [Paenalkalicoccus suaedae]QKS72725.1 gluconokinase [Paenalkalicoccus suaedae]